MTRGFYLCDAISPRMNFGVKQLKIKHQLCHLVWNILNVSEPALPAKNRVYMCTCPFTFFPLNIGWTFLYFVSALFLSVTLHRWWRWWWWWWWTQRAGGTLWPLIRTWLQRPNAPCPRLSAPNTSQTVLVVRETLPVPPPLRPLVMTTSMLRPASPARSHGTERHPRLQPDTTGRSCSAEPTRGQ